MDSKEYFEEMKKIQENLLDYLDYESNTEEKYQNIQKIFDDIKIHDNRYKIKSIMHLLLHISNNHHREEGFFGKIEQILSLFKDDLKKYFSNSEIFNIFESNKRVLLFLSEAKIMEFDEYVVKQIVSDRYVNSKYPQYFQPEIQPFTKENWFSKYNYYNWAKEIKEEIPKDFYEKRKIGENDDLICELIRKDKIEEFIIYVNKNDCPLDSIIDQSIYETNRFLLGRNITLIEYSVFFGSIQIFKYLYKNDVQIESSLWTYAIHGKDEEIFHCLGENHEEMLEALYKKLLMESIKCHHTDFANYFQNNILTNKEENEEEEEEEEEEESEDSQILIESLRYYNFIFIQTDKIDEKLFIYLCEFDYYIPVLNLLMAKNIDKSKTKVKKKIFFNIILYHIF